MTTYVFDGTKIGLLSCVFDSYYGKHTPNKLTDKDGQVSFFDKLYTIESNVEKSNRVTKCLNNIATPNVLKDVNLALKSGQEDKYTVIFNYIKTAIDNKKIDISKNFADKHVLAFFDIIKKVSYEIHRFKGFIRFEQSVDGYYYAHYTPDNDITWHLMPHFAQRFADQAFIIHDTKRNVLGMYDGYEVKTINAEDRQVTVYLSDEEINFKKLWQTYYKSVNIKERKNHKLMKQFLPLKYWNNLPEKQIELASF